jgi:hypothetical protein
MVDNIFPPEVPKVGQKIRIADNETITETIVLRRTKTGDDYTILFPNYDGNPFGKGDNIDYAVYSGEKRRWTIVSGCYFLNETSSSSISIID